MSSTSVALGVVTVLFLLAYASRRPRLPPGPRGLPLIGNLFDMPLAEQWKAITEMSFKYGDLVYLRVFSTSFMFVHGVKPTNELFDKRGSIYSDRPHLPMACDLCGLGELVPLTPFGPRFKMERKLMSQSLSRRAVAKWEPYLLEEMQTLLKDLIATPDQFVLCLRRMSSSLIFRTIYGYRVEKSNDPYVKAAEELMDISTYAITGPWLVNFVPLLRYIPNLSFQKLAAGWKSKTKEWVDDPYQLFLGLKDTPEARVSFCGNLLPETSGDAEKEQITKWIAASVYGAGADTTVASLTQLIQAMVLHPHILKKVHEEIDSVVGRERLPDFSDRPKLPYLEAVMKESLRWGTPVPFTVPHRLMQDDEYDGHIIPKGTMCIGNMWAILHDERLFDNPHEFQPERYLNITDEETRRLLDPSTYMFGFGRRRCPGIEFAEPSLWIQTAMILSCFSISHAKHKDGSKIEVKAEYESASIRHPKPFKCHIAPRYSHISRLINEEWIVKA